MPYEMEKHTSAPQLSTAVVIPAYRPTSRLIDIAYALAADQSVLVVIVDDGSEPFFDDIFARPRTETNILVLLHATNLGKGAALKTGFNHVLVNYPHVGHITTADADGQHDPDDVRKVIVEAGRYPDDLILGVRKFGKGTPLRSYVGNKLSSLVYRAVLGLAISDTQTGMRSLPKELARRCLRIANNRYEFETEMLALANSSKVRIREVPIRTIYEAKNASSHFNPVLDSFRIYFSVLRYAFASILTAATDFFVFIVVLGLGGNVITSNLCARFVALYVQFFLIKKVVFRVRAGIWQFILFVVYVSLTGVIVSVLQLELSAATTLAPVYSKAIVETIFFVFNFLFLRDVLFRRGKQ